MGVCGDREKGTAVSAEQQWDYINLSDFKSSSCFTPFSYGILYISLIISIACYGIDIFTAVNLLVFDRWGQIEPAIPVSISRWIFVACIILSWIFLVYRWLNAVRAMRSGGVANSYLDPLAVRIQSIRTGTTGRGWRRFLVFAELTKSRKGSEYVALFAYFSFEAWMRILLAEGPRNAINAMTLYSVMQAKLIPVGKHAPVDGSSSIGQFFINLKILASSNGQQAAILLGMLFTLVIWVVAALSLAVSCILYIMFLWHHIPSHDGGLSGFCRRKVDSRLRKIVRVKVNKALAKDNTMNLKGDKDGSTAGGPQELKRQPTLPLLETGNDDKLPEMPMLSRQTTQASLPPYTSQPAPHNDDPMPGIQRQPTLPDIWPEPSRPMPPSRSATQSSAQSSMSYASNAPLMGSVVPMGNGPPGRAYSPVPLSRIRTDHSMGQERPGMNRSMTTSTQASQRSYGSARPSYAVPGDPLGPLSRQNTQGSDYQTPGWSTPGPPNRQDSGPDDHASNTRFGPPTRQNTGGSAFDSSGRRPLNRQNTGTSESQADGRFGPPSRQNTKEGFHNMSGRSTPVSSSQGTPGAFDQKSIRQFGPPKRQNTETSDYQFNERSTPNGLPMESQGRRTPMQTNLPDIHGRDVLGPQRRQQPRVESFEMRSQTPAPAPTTTPNQGQYVAYKPTTQTTPSAPLARNFSTPARQPVQNDYFNSRQPAAPQRSGTAPLPQIATYDDSIYDSYSLSDDPNLARPAMPVRAATAGPGARVLGRNPAPQQGHVEHHLFDY